MPTAWPFGRSRQAGVAASHLPGLAEDRPGFGRHRSGSSTAGPSGRVAAQSDPDDRSRADRKPYGVWLAGAHIEDCRDPCVNVQTPPVFLLWGDKARRFFERAVPAGAGACAATRHPSNDMQRRFMAEGSHFRRPPISSTRGRSEARDGATRGQPVLSSRALRGGVPEWLKGADCKSVGLRLRWFESSLLHHRNCRSIMS